MTSTASMSGNDSSTSADPLDGLLPVIIAVVVVVLIILVVITGLVWFLKRYVVIFSDNETLLNEITLTAYR